LPLKVVTGFEYGTLAGITTGNVGNKLADVTAGNPTIITTSPRTGNYCLRCSPAAITEGVKWTTDSIGSSQTRLLFTFAFRFPGSLPGADTPFWAMHCVGPDMAGWFITARDGHVNSLAVSFDDITYFYSAQQIVADRWYYLEAHWDVSATPTIINWKVDGHEAQSASGVTLSTIAECEVGYINNARTFTADYDDITIWTDTATIPFVGPQKVVLLKPDPAATLTVNGATTNWQTFSGATPTETTWNATTARDNIDEVPINIGSSQDGFDQIVSSATAYVEVPMTSYQLIGRESVLGARMLVPGWAASITASTIGFRSWNGNTETTLFAAADPNFDNSATDPAWVCKMLTLADIDTQTEIDNLAFRIGFGNAAVHTGIHAIYAELAITEEVQQPSNTFKIPNFLAYQLANWYENRFSMEEATTAVDQNVTPVGIDDQDNVSSGVTVALVISPVGIASQESLGNLTLTTTNTVTPVGIPSSESLGNIVTSLTITPVGIPSQESQGSPTVANVSTIAPIGIPSEQKLGTPAIDQTLGMYGIQAQEFLGNVSVAATYAIATFSITSSEALGNATVANVSTIAPYGIIGNEAFGIQAISRDIAPYGIASSEALGTAALTLNVTPFGITSTETLGQASISLVTTISPFSISSAESVGRALAVSVITPQGIPSSETLGTISTTLTISPFGVTSQETVGATSISLVTTITPYGVPGGERFGVQSISRDIAPIGTPTTEAFGNPTITTGAVTLSPVGIGTSEAFGQPTTLQVTTVTAYGIQTQERVGNPTVSITLIPVGIPSPEAFGNVTVSAGVVTVSTFSIRTSESFGLPAVTLGLQVFPFGIGSSAGMGFTNIYRVADVNTSIAQPVIDSVFVEELV
jgi:hypothetical protein